ncbi:hypothetical protein EKO04_003535 [Ascochyta lentis]|uniref:Uncharacterized protein n=1 Tax=Ascochyta lentis TaxID=205686 RepID=A0A8H7J7Q6_9PLEO|nr:hypothetical protein EKO04_003535 [Ascochyta lentis]
MTAINGPSSKSCEDTVCTTAPTYALEMPRIGFFGRWGKRASVAPSMTTHLITPNILNDDPDSCDGCEELKMQSEIKQSILKQYAADLEATEAEVKALRDTTKKLRIQLDVTKQGNIRLRLEQANFTRELRSKDDQLASKAKESTMYANACSELAAQMAQQHKHLTDAHAKEKHQNDAMHANHQRELAFLEAKLEAKDHEVTCLQSKLKEQDVAGDKSEPVNDDEIARVVDKGKAAGGAEEPQHKDEEHSFDTLTELRARIASLEAENAKLYAQCSTEGDLDAALDEA